MGFSLSDLDPTKGIKKLAHSVDKATGGILDKTHKEFRRFVKRKNGFGLGNVVKAAIAVAFIYAGATAVASWQAAGSVATAEVGGTWTSAELAAAGAADAQAAGAMTFAESTAIATAPAAEVAATTEAALAGAPASWAEGGGTLAGSVGKEVAAKKSFGEIMKGAAKTIGETVKEGAGWMEDHPVFSGIAANTIAGAFSADEIDYARERARLEEEAKQKERKRIDAMPVVTSGIGYQQPKPQQPQQPQPRYQQKPGIVQAGMNTTPRTSTTRGNIPQRSGIVQGALDRRRA